MSSVVFVILFLYVLSCCHFCCVTDNKLQSTLTLTDPCIQDTSTHHLQKTKRLENWGAIQEKLLSIGTELNYLAPHNTCVSCSEESETIYRCLDCWPGSLFCLSCIQDCHCRPHLHMFEGFKDGTFLFVNLETPEWTRPDRHCCPSSYSREIVVVDEKGRQHKRAMRFCSCETHAETMLRSNLWPSSPKNPVLGFHIGLLEWMTALLLECHVSSKGFCEALRARLTKHQKGFVDSQVSNVYTILMNECFVQYRYYKSRIRHLTHLCKELRTGSQCPACFENPTKVLSFDADFQLVRKMSSGMAASKAKHDGEFFIDQSKVDAFMAGYAMDSNKECDCNDFKAGSALRSKAKNKKLDETAVFGSACRHEFPYLFFNLKYGERIGYSVFLLEKVVAENEASNIHILYDIACIMEKHLKKNGRTDLLDAVTLAIPIFHCYGHKMACQILYNPRRISGFGMSDGECMERMWSFLGKFANISKEMTPENRVDLLIDALVHYGERITHKQGNTLAEKLLKTAELKISTSKLLEETLAPLTGLTSEDVKKWSLEEKESYQTNSDACLENKERLTPSESYALNLEKYIELSQSLMATENQLIKGDIKKKISSTEHLLKRYEVSNKVQRWPSSSDDFILNSAKQKETNTLFKKLQKLMAERTFLLQMMKKDARGQSISKRLNKQLQKVNQSITTLIKVYNEVESSKKPGPETLDFDSLKATITETAAMTTEMRRVLINLVDTLERCDEEDEMIRTEMKCVVNYYRMQHNAVMLSLSKSNSITMTSVLLSEGLNIERRMCHLNKMFSTGIVVPDVPLFFHKHAHLDNPYLESDVDDIINSLGADEDLLQDAENWDEQLDNDKELSESEDDSE